MAGFLKALRGGWVNPDLTPVSGTPAVQNRRQVPPRIGVGFPAQAIDRQRALPGVPLTVLLVEDEPVLLKATRRMLEQRGFSVVGVDTAKAALELIAGGTPFELLMTDVSLRHCRGTELARRARLVRPGLRVLYVSGLDAESAGLGGPNSGDVFLAKPFLPEELDDRLRDLSLPASGASAVEKRP
jgi:CheY-like chemotaxis protein